MINLSSTLRAMARSSVVPLRPGRDRTSTTIPRLWNALVPRCSPFRWRGARAERRGADAGRSTSSCSATSTCISPTTSRREPQRATSCAHGRQGGARGGVRHPAAADVGPRELRRLRADLLPADRRAALLLLVHRRLGGDAVPLADQGAAGSSRSHDHRLQPCRHVRGRSHPPRARDVPGVFTGIGEFTIHKEFVSSKIAGGPGSLADPALDRILDFAGEVGCRPAAQRRRHSVPEAGPGALPAQADRRPLPAPSGDHHHLGAHRPRARGATGQGPARHRRARARRPAGPDAPRLLRHLVGRGRQVHRGELRSRSPRPPLSSTATPIASCSGATRWVRPIRPST